MPYKKFFLWLCSLLIVGCAPISTPTPYATPMLWQIARTPSLSWLDNSFNLCIQEQNEYRIIVAEQPLNAILKQDADISILWGEPDPLAEFAYDLGEDELTFVVHPDNPLQEISFESIQKIFSGQEVFWPADQDASQSPAIPWKYPEGNEVQQILEKTLGISSPTGESVQTTPDIAGMLEHISQNPEAIGFLPKSQIDSRVKPIQISGLSPQSLTFPIIALSSAQPDMYQTAWLVCIQKKIAADS